MARLSPVNDAFVKHLTRFGNEETAPLLWHGIGSALGVTAGSALRAAEYPVLGFYVTSSAEAFLAYVLTPGRFIRYEVVGDRSLTIALPLARISRVVEATGPSDLLLTVELDADALAGVTEAVQGGARSRTERTVYELTAGDPESSAMLGTFSVALRSALGM